MSKPLYIVYKRASVVTQEDAMFGGGSWLKASPPMSRELCEQYAKILGRKRGIQVKVEKVKDEPARDQV